MINLILAVGVLLVAATIDTDKRTRRLCFKVAASRLKDYRRSARTRKAWALYAQNTR
jgi:hypothetical protein